MRTIGYKFFDNALRVRFSSLVEEAFAQKELLLHSPGTLVNLTKGNQGYVYWRYYQGTGKQRDEYIGPAADEATQAKVGTIEATIAETKSLMDGSRLLRKAGFAAVDNSTALTLATLFNAKFFREGGMLVGTHAFGALLNALGVRPVAHYYTEDVDIARYRQIKVALQPDQRFVDLLRESGLPFVEVPQLDSRQPSSSFRVRGEKLKVDLLVPGDHRYAIHPIPELHTHATGLPFFDYLLRENTMAIVLGRDHVVPVRIPTAAHYCLHKLIVADMRTPTNANKKEKDLTQAALLAAVLSEHFPGTLEEAQQTLPRGASRHVKRSAAAALNHLDQESPGYDFLAQLK